jgi:hypothetical protein
MVSPVKFALSVARDEGGFQMPPSGLWAAIVVNAAWIGFLEYWDLYAGDLGHRVLSSTPATLTEPLSL